MNILELGLKRIYFAPTYTIGKFSISNNYFCDTLEDYDRDIDHDGKLDSPKVYGKTCIPRGRYEVEMRMSPHFGRMLPHIIDVPGFEGILIHSGNDADDTLGCVLVGKNTVKGGLTTSRVTSDTLNIKITEGLKLGKVFITIE